MDKLTKYLDDNLIQYEVLSDDVIKIDSKTYQLVEPVQVKKEGFTKLTHYDEEGGLIHTNRGYDYLVLFMGDRYWYVDSTELDNSDIKELKWIGSVDDDNKTKNFLGVHGGFELMSGSGTYSDWVKKAKFVSIEALGLIEKGTLAGTLKFTLECLKNDIKPIVGATYEVKRDNGKRYDIKLYVKNWKGWNNLLNIQYEYNYVRKSTIPEDVFMKNTEGLILVLDPKSLDFDDVFPIDITNDVFYQLDTAEFDDDDFDYWYLQNLKKYFDSKIRPVLITDAYYIDKKDFEIRGVLSKMSNTYNHSSKNQYFKTNQEYLFELMDLFDESDSRLFDVYDEALTNTQFIVDECNFVIETGKRHLPSYEMTAEEKTKYGDVDNMFWELIQEGLDKYYPDYSDEILDRVMEEYETIKGGGFIDYFLNTRDILNWSRDVGIYVGLGRGSAAGCLISRLLDIVKIDPMRYDLLFSRFLNKGRIGESIECNTITITTEDGEEKQLYPDDEITIFNDGVEEIVKVRQLKEGDIIK